MHQDRVFELEGDVHVDAGRIRVEHADRPHGVAQGNEHLPRDGTPKQVVLGGNIYVNDKQPGASPATQPTTAPATTQPSSIAKRVEVRSSTPKSYPGSIESTGIVTDVGLFLNLLTQRLRKLDQKESD